MRTHLGPAFAMLASLGLALPLACERPARSTPVMPEHDATLEFVRLREDIRHELEAVTRPLGEVDLVIDRVTTLPERLGTQARAIGRLMLATLAGEVARVSVGEGLTEADRREIEAVATQVRELGVALRALPEQGTKAEARIGVLARTAADRFVVFTRESGTALVSPFSTDAEKRAWTLEHARITELASRIEAEANEAKTAVGTLALRSQAALGRLEATFVGLAPAADPAAVDAADP